METITNNKAFANIFVEFENNKRFDTQEDSTTLSLMLILELRQINFTLEGIRRGHKF